MRTRKLTKGPGPGQWVETIANYKEKIEVKSVKLSSKTKIMCFVKKKWWKHVLIIYARLIIEAKGWSGVGVNSRKAVYSSYLIGD